MRRTPPWLSSLASLLLLAWAGSGAASESASPGVVETPVSNTIAVSFDDLPWVMARNEPPADLPVRYAQLLASLKQANVPVIGFVNDGLLYEQDTLRKERLQLLRDWLDAGFELGNHTAWHSDLHAVGVQAFEADIRAGERQLKPLLAEYGQAPRWFRHPFLRTGRTPEEKKAVNDFLAGRGYRVAPVTINSSEWIYASAYRKVLADGGDTALLAKVREAYLDYMLDKLYFYQRRSIRLLGYNLPQILVLHANELNAAVFPVLASRIRSRGYRFVTLDEATADPAYQRSDEYYGELGTSWIHRWARTEHRPESFFHGETMTHDWVRALAGVEPGAE